MSKFEKTIIPLIDECIKTVDLTAAAGFIDSYTEDPDNPNGDAELFLVYDDTVRNDFVSDRMRRFESSMNIKRTYVKYVDNVPYYIYSFWVKPEVKKLYNGILSLNTVQKARILQFWGPFDSTVDELMMNQVSLFDVEHNMPLEDYRESQFERTGLTINKKGMAPFGVTPFFIDYNRMIL